MRTSLLVVGTAVALAVTAVPARAAGVGGVEVTPPDGTSFSISVRDGETERQSFTVRNVTASPATVRLYGASAVQSQSGDGWSVGGAGSAEWLDLPDQEVSLAAGESRELSFAVRGGEQDRTGAVVVEKGTGSVVQRAATLVHVDAAAPLPLPLLAVAAAVALVVLAASGWAGAASQRRRRDASPVAAQA